MKTEFDEWYEQEIGYDNRQELTRNQIADKAWNEAINRGAKYANGGSSKDAALVFKLYRQLKLKQRSKNERPVS